MAFWNSTQIININEGTLPNDGTGDNIRDAFNKVDTNFGNIATQLSQFNQDWTNANVEYNFQAQFGNISNLFVANSTGINSTFTSNTTSANIIATAGLYSSGVTYLTGNTYVAAPIIPATNGLYDIGSPTNRFRTIYSQTTDAATQISSSSDSGILKVHANAFVGDQQDTGILGNISSDYNGHSTYAFFGHQFTTNDFIYKITNIDATLGNNIVAGGIYGNGHFGSAFLSNSTPSTNTATGALVVTGGAGFGGDVNIGGNANVSGNLAVAGSQVLTVSSVGISNIYNGTGSIFTGNTVFPAATPSTSYNTGAVVITNGGLGVFGNVTAGGFVGPYYGTVQTAAQPQITSLGSLTSLTISGPTNAAGISATSLGVTALTVTSTITATGVALTGLSNVGTGTFYATGNSTVSNINSSGNVSASYYLGSGTFLTGLLNNSTFQTLNANVGAFEIWANANVSSLQNQITGANSAIQTISANVGAYEISVNANIGGHQLAIAGINANLGAYQIANNANVGTITNNIQTINANIGAFETYANIQLNGGSTQSLSANVGAYQIATNANIGGHQLAIANLATGANANTAAYLATSSITFGGTITVPSIAHSGTSGTGNIGASGAAFNTVFATATTALYADLAEKYASDADYEAGTVVVFGGEKEITTTMQFGDVSVAGAISTKPAYLMNEGAIGLPVALRGRIPVKVIGPVTKGDLLVTAGQNPGYATSVGKSTEYPLAVFAKALETNTAEGVKVIEAVII